MKNSANAFGDEKQCQLLWRCVNTHLPCFSTVAYLNALCKFALKLYCLPPTTDEVYVFARTPAFVLSVCLSVCVQDYSKMHAWIWMTCCVSTGIGTWTNWLTFEPDLGHGPDAWTGILSPIAYVLQRGNVEFYYVGKIPYTYWYWKPVEAAVHGFEASKHRCRR